MYLMTEDKNRRNLSLDAKTITKDLTLNQNFNTKMRKSTSYYKERDITLGLGNVYTSICKNFYPLIMEVDNGKIKKDVINIIKYFHFIVLHAKSIFAINVNVSILVIHL